MRQWSILTALAALVVLAGGFMLLVKPARHHASTLRQQAVTEEQGNQMLLQQLRILKAQQRDEPKNQAELAAVAAKIPNNPGLPSLIRALSAAADDSGVVLFAIVPAQPTLVTAPVSAPAPAAPATTAKTSKTAGPVVPAAPAVEQYASIPVQLTVGCPYFQCEQFISGLESLNRAYLVTGFTLQHTGGDGSQAAPQTAPSPAPGSNVISPTNLPPGWVSLTVNGDVFMSVAQAANSAAGGSVTTTPAQPAK